jgi:hypothetical protein
LCTPVRTLREKEKNGRKLRVEIPEPRKPEVNINCSIREDHVSIDRELQVETPWRKRILRIEIPEARKAKLIPSVGLEGHMSLGR